jgi:hypothetical protein
MDERTARWYLSLVTKPGPEDDSLLPENFPEAWIAEHDGLHTSAQMRPILDEFFRRSFFEWGPYIAEHYLARPELTTTEVRLIDSAQINPVGFRYVGVRGQP